MKQIILVSHDGGELGNQLWTYVSIYAYALSQGYLCKNWAFFEYEYLFIKRQKEPLHIKVINIILGNFAKRRNSWTVRVIRKFYKIFIEIPLKIVISSDQILISNISESGFEKKSKTVVINLPPTVPLSGKLLNFRNSLAKNFYIYQYSGGMLRNPIGIKYYRETIIQNFKPTNDTTLRVENIMRPLKEEYSKIVGVHIRQTDYRTFKGGKYFISQTRTAEILKEYLALMTHESEKVCFVIASDERVDCELFKDFNIAWAPGDITGDLFTLAACDSIIGTNSTFGHFAAFYGNKPHIIMKNRIVDWDYYLNKKTYFINKYFLDVL